MGLNKSEVLEYEKAYLLGQKSGWIEISKLTKKTLQKIVLQYAQSNSYYNIEKDLSLGVRF